jgi:tetratricopeptide (TPR) repeat protein
VFELREDRSWERTEAPEPGSDAWVIAEARRLILDGQGDRAERMMTRWLRDEANAGKALRARALLVRGDARVADRDEYRALYDYEELIREFPESDAFEKAVERELEIGLRYLGGLKRKVWGIRWVDATDIGIETLIRVQERMPGSDLAERASIELADYFYRERRIELADEAYGLYLESFPEGRHARKAARRRIYAAIARYQGPAYDASMLLDAQVRIRRFKERFPAEADRRGINEGLVGRLDESLAAQLLNAAEWYLDTGEDASARLTLRRLIDRYPETLSAAAGRRIMGSRGWSVDGAGRGAWSVPASAREGSGVDASGGGGGGAR